MMKWNLNAILLFHERESKAQETITYLFWFNLSASEILHTIQEAGFRKFIVCSQKLFEL